MTIADSFTITPADIPYTATTIKCLASCCRQVFESRPSQKISEYEIPAYTEVSGKLTLKVPPPHISLSDQLVFAILQNDKGGKSRGTIWEMDFDSNGHIRRDRIPRGPPVISWANGIPFFTVYGGYYILGGDYLAKRSWLLSSTSIPIHPGCIAGPVIASSEAIPENPFLPSEQIHDFEVESRQNITWETKTDLERTQTHFTTYIKDHSKLSLIFIGSDSFGFVSISESSSYNVFLDPEHTNLVNPMQVPSYVWNLRKKYVNNEDMKFEFPVLHHPLFPHLNKRASTRTPIPMVILPESPMKIKSYPKAPETPTRKHYKKETTPEKTMPKTPIQKDRKRTKSN